MKIFDEKFIKINEIENILRQLFNDKVNIQLDEVVNLFRNIFNGEKKDCTEQSITKSSLNFKNAEHFYLTGLDIPCWISNDGTCIKNIMIIASEPLRSENAFKLSNNLDGYNSIILNTPFSFHCFHEVGRQEKNQYWDFIEKLVEEYQANVYLTDARKIWFAGWEQHSEFANNIIFNNILKSEIDLIKPDFIITFGTTPLQFLKVKEFSFKENITDKVFVENLTTNKYRVIPLIHPSKTASGHRKKFLEFNEVYDKESNDTFRYLYLIRKIIKKI